MALFFKTIALLLVFGIYLKKITDCFERGNKLFFAVMLLCCRLSTYVAEFVVKLKNIRKSLPAIALTSNNSIITAISNDIDYNYVFVRQLESMINPRDILIGISTGVCSQNIENSFEYAIIFVQYRSLVQATIY